MSATSNPPLPERIAGDDEAVEILRAWISRGEAVTSMRPALADPAHFGALLAGVAQQMAERYAEAGAMSEGEALDKIRAGWGAPR